MSEQNKGGFRWELPNNNPEKIKEQRQINFNLVEVLAILGGINLLRKKHLDDLSIARAFVQDEKEKERIQQLLTEGMEKLDEIERKIKKELENRL